MKKLFFLSLILMGCSQTLPLEQDLKNLTSMIHTTYLCVEETTAPVAAQWDDREKCLLLNMQEMQKIANKYGIDAAKGVWLHELAFFKERGVLARKEKELAADTFVGCQMKKRGLDTDQYFEYLIHEYTPNKHQGTLIERVEAVNHGYDNCK